jgi:membrane-associated protein
VESLLQGANDFAVHLADSGWVYWVVFAFAAFDALVPVVPSESVVVALAAISQSTGEPHLAFLALAAGLGAFVGDNTTFRLGRLIGIERFGWMRRPRMVAAFATARHELDHRAALLILTARYVPVGRVAVNLTAGATGFGYRRFVPLAALAALTWSGYSVLIGVVAGQWAADHPLYGAAVAVTIAVALGLGIDRGLARWRRRRSAADLGQD